MFITKHKKLNKKAIEQGYENLYDFFHKNPLLDFKKMAEILNASYQSISIAHEEYIQNMNETIEEDRVKEK